MSDVGRLLFWFEVRASVSSLTERRRAGLTGREEGKQSGDGREMREERGSLLTVTYTL